MRRFLDIQPEHPDALNYESGTPTRSRASGWTEAEQFIVRALDMKPDDGFITDSLGWVYYKQGRYREAVETLRKASDAAPDDPVMDWEHLGDAWRALGEPEQARHAYQRTLELAPDNESARRKLGEL